MARDCSDRQRGANWRNDDKRGSKPAGSGTGDAVDREYEVCILVPPYMVCHINVFLSNLCKNFRVALQLRLKMVRLLVLLKAVPAAVKTQIDLVATAVVATTTTTAAIVVLSPGSEAPQVVLHHGNAVRIEDLLVMHQRVPPALVQVFLHGNKAATPAPVWALLLPGHKLATSHPTMVRLITLLQTHGMHHLHLLCRTQ